MEHDRKEAVSRSFAISPGAADPDTAALPDTRCAPGSREDDAGEYVGGWERVDKSGELFYATK